MGDASMEGAAQVGYARETPHQEKTTIGGLQGQLNGELSGLAETIEMLTKHLDPILDQRDNTKPSAVLESVPSAVSGVGSEIVGQINRVRDMRRRVERLIHDTEL